MNTNKYLNCIDIIYWINLDRSLDRRNKMLQIFNEINIPNQRIKAIDGKNESNKNIYNRFTNTQLMRSKTEYACLLSHLDTIKTFNNSTYELALILEDDTTLEYAKFWNKSICNIIGDAPADWDIIMLNYVTKNPLKNIYTFNKNGNISCCQAYLINKRGSRKLISDILQSDGKYKLNTQFAHTSDNYIFASLITYVYKYPYFTYPIDNESTIHNWHINFHNYAKIIALNAWKDYYNFILINDYNLDNEKIPFVYDKKKIIQYSVFVLLIIIIILSMHTYY